METCQNSWSPYQDLKPGPLNYETGLLTSRPRRSVLFTAPIRATSFAYLIVIGLIVLEITGER
jgi:hypothetical protein